jgi:GTP-binding protein HflX
MIVLASAVTGEGIPQLLQLIAELAPTTLERIEVTLPPDRGDLLAMLHREGHVEQAQSDPETGNNTLVALLPRKLLPQVQDYCR